MKIHKGYVDNQMEFEKVKIDDIGIDIIRDITLSDLYEYMAYVSRIRVIAQAHEQEKLPV